MNEDVRLTEVRNWIKPPGHPEHGDPALGGCLLDCATFEFVMPAKAGIQGCS